MSTRNTLLGVAALAGAFFVGRLFASDDAPPPPPPPVVQHAPAHGTSTAEIRSAIRAELTRDPITIEQAEAAPAPADDEPSADVLDQRAKALTQARGVVDSAVRIGRWTSDDARALIVVLPQLGPEEYDEIMTALIRPVNAGHVKVETNGMLLDPT